MSERSRREIILDHLQDMVGDLLYYDRKEDETLPVGAIEEAVKAGEITIDEMLEHIRKHMTGSGQAMS